MERTNILGKKRENNITIANLDRAENAMRGIIISVAADPWIPFEAQSKGKGKGIVPETPFFGAILVGISLLCVILARFSNRHKD